MMRLSLCFLVVAALLGSSSGRIPSSGDSAGPEGLARVFEPGWILQDRSGDDQVDFVDVRIVLPDEPAPEEVAAAAAVAGRFGFETSGLSLPLVVRATEIDETGEAHPLVVLGASNPLLPEVVAQRLEELREGQGLVVSIKDRVVLAGKDPAGTRAAAEAFAARSPYLWEVIGRENGETAERVASDVVEVLKAGGIQAGKVTLVELVFEKDRAEAVSATFDLALEPEEAVQARAVLERVLRSHARGEETDRLSYSSVAKVLLRLGGGESVSLPRVGLPERLLTPRRVIPVPEEEEEPGRPKEKPPLDFDLSDLFTTRGLLEDTDKDRLPDATGTVLVLPSAEDASVDLPRRGTAHLAARLGLESTGVRFPLVRLDSEIEDPKGERSLVLLGGRGTQADELRRVGKRRAPAPAPGRGVVEVVPKAFGDSPAVVVSGGSPEGAEAAADYLARRAPYLWTARRGEPTLDDVEEAVRALLNGKTAAGQAALALAKVDDILKGLEGKELDFMGVEAFLEEAVPAFDGLVSEEIRRRLSVDRVDVTSRGRREPEVVFEEKPGIDWEVDAFWRIFRQKVLSALGGGERVWVELRVSEAPQLREEVAGKIRRALAEKGAQVDEVTVLSAYKQGLSWLLETVAPALGSKPVARLEIAWKPFPVDPSKKWRFYAEPARWLNELYPADEVLAEKLGIPLTAISFVMKEDLDAVYEVTAQDAAGSTLYRDAFSPTFYERPYLDLFPDKARVTVTTGWLRVEVDGRTTVDERIPTDLDRVWDHYQSSTLEKVHQHVKESTGDKPTQDKQPFFHTLRFELTASEPDYRLGVDQELITSLESIHDDVYFDTLDFFYEIVEEAEGKPIPRRRLAPGNILPWIHPERRGQAPEVAITYSENASHHPKIVVRYRIKGKDEKSETEELEPVKLPPPSAYLAEVEAGREGLARLGLRVELEKTEPLSRLADLLDHLTRLREAGVFEEALSFSGISEVAVRLEAPGAIMTRVYAFRGAPERKEAPAPYEGRGLITWDHVISPAESERLAATLGTLPEVTTYVAGRSYQGRPVSVMEIRLPIEAGLVSQAKLSTWKPVLSIMGRQHANEVSSTSHILRLAELLATDPAYRRYLKRVNFVIQPVVNPDGAALAYELQKLTPLHCLHAGRYSALGPDVPREAKNPETLVTEARVLRKVFNTWLPDVQLNPHGYPTHEWVQTFANYNPKGFRSYWIPRGWWTSVRPIEDPRYPHHQEAARILRDAIAEEVSRDPEARETNLRIYDRYRRWALRWQPHVYHLEVHRDTAIYTSRRSPTATRPDAQAATTVFSGFTEAMDETAQGDWLDLAARMGFGYLMASVRFLDEAKIELYRLEEERRGKVILSLTRPRPLKHED